MDKRTAFARALCLGLLASGLALGAHLVAGSDRVEASAPWQGTVATDGLNVRSAPSTAAPRVDVLEQGTPVTVVGWVSGEEVEPTNNIWAQVGDGRYVYSSLIRRELPKTPPAPPEGVGFAGRWIDVNITQQVLTAYEGSTPVRVALISSGRPDYPSPQGTFRILKRVYNETMTSATLPWVRDSYRLENVLFTQYFNGYGAALHLAWWKEEGSFGVPTSHGCVGLSHEDAEWLWNWASVGVPVSIHR